MVNELSNVDVIAVSLVNKGANRKQFFLRKAADEEKDTLLTLPAGDHRLLKRDDWSAVYCVVAEPGALEDSGVGGTAAPDQWASDEEIRKACHRFAKNGALINKMHETLDPFGVMVENAIAPVDFDVDGHTIRKGSWYIAIEPSEDGRSAIEKGELTGVSIEGTGLRTPVSKGTDDLAALAKSLDVTEAELLGMTADEIVEKAGGFWDESKFKRQPKGAAGGGQFAPKSGGGATAATASFGTPGMSARGSLGPNVNAKTGKRAGKNAGTGGDGSKAVTPKGWKGANPRLAASKWNAMSAKRRVKLMNAWKEQGGKLGPNRKWGENGTIITRRSDRDKFRSWDKMNPAERKAVLAGGRGGFDRQGARDARQARRKKNKSTVKKLGEFLGITENVEKSATFSERMAADQLDEQLPKGMDLLRSVIFRAVRDPETTDPAGVIRASVSEFADWADSLLATEEAIQKQAELIDPEGSTEESRTTEGEMETPDERTELVDDITKGVLANLAKALGAPVEEDEQPTVESIAKAVGELKGVGDEDELVARVASIEANLKKLGEGDSSQNDEPEAEQLTKADIAKAYEDAGVNPALKGLI